MPNTMRAIADLYALLADNTSGDISPQDVRDIVASLDDTGWAQYRDTQYTSASPLVLSPDTDTILPNNAGLVLDAEIPSDVTSFYNGSVVTGRDGDGITISVNLTARPTAGSTTILETWFDIGGAIGAIYRRLVSFPKGPGVERPINFTVTGYTLNTWEANGATAYVRANGPVEVYDIDYIITRTHRGSRR